MPSQKSLFDHFRNSISTEAAALAAGRAGEHRATEHADPQWHEKALHVVHFLCRSKNTWCVDDVWDELDRRQVARPHEARAIAGVLREACRRGWCRRTRALVRSAQRQCHGNLRSQYESLVCPGGTL